MSLRPAVPRPSRLRAGAQALVEGDGVGVPVQHVPLDPALAALPQFGQQRGSMTLPPELFAKQEEKPITDIDIPALTVTPLEIPTIPSPKE